VGPAGVPPHCDSNELPCPADANARIEAQKQFLKLSSTRPRHAVTIVAIPANRAPEPMTKIARRGGTPRRVRRKFEAVQTVRSGA